MRFKVIHEGTTIPDTRAVEILFMASAQAIQNKKINLQLMERITEIAIQINKNELPHLSLSEVHTAGVVLGVYLVKLLNEGGEIIMEPDASSSSSDSETDSQTKSEARSPVPNNSNQGD